MAIGIRYAIIHVHGLTEVTIKYFLFVYFQCYSPIFFIIQCTSNKTSNQNKSSLKIDVVHSNIALISYMIGENFTQNQNQCTIVQFTNNNL